MAAAIEYANGNPRIEKIFVIGGVRVYIDALTNHNVTRVWMTIIKREFPTDRDVRFISKYLSKYTSITLLHETEEYVIWKYE
jgi:dihydrofolate reductase